jgi:nucleoid DNA-binding protein
MTQAELQEIIVRQAKITNQQSLYVLYSMYGAIKQELIAGREVKLEKFGIFKSVHTQSRSARNPRTNQPILIPARNKPVFLPSRLFRAYLNTIP